MRKKESQTQRDGHSLVRLALPLLALALLLCVLVCAAFAEMDTSRNAEFAQAADPFGYLQMAQDIRQGSAPHGLPRFTVDSDHLRIYLSFLKTHGWNPEGEYGPGVYHFAAGTDKIISPYPPGVGEMLALFPAGRAVFIWQMITAGALVLLAALACGWMLKKRTKTAALAGALFCLLAVYGLLTLGLAVSFSVDLSWLPLLVAVAAGFLGTRKAGWAGWLLLALAGAALGWATLVRLADGVFLVGFLALCAGGGRGRWKKSGVRMAGFLAGFAIAGVIPLMIYDAAMTGSALRSTYLAKDASSYSLSSAGSNALYYFAGDGSDMLWVSACGAAGFLLWCIAGGALKSGRSPEANSEPIRERAAQTSIRSQIAALAFWWAAPTLYFLVHKIYTPYYQLPTMFVTLAGMACTVAGAKDVTHLGAGRWKQYAFWPALAAVAGMALFQAADLPAMPDPASVALPDVSLPAALENPQAWIIADRLGGALWYYHGIATQSVVGLDTGTRAAFWDFLHQRGDPVYVIVDNPVMVSVAEEIQKNGATLLDAGGFASGKGENGERTPYTTVYRVRWGSGAGGL